MPWTINDINRINTRNGRNEVDVPETADSGLNGKSMGKAGKKIHAQEPLTNQREGWQTILGVCPSKSNCYRIGHKGLFKTEALTKYEENFYIQCNHYRDKNLKGYFELHVDVFYPSERADLDNAMKIILDCLQKAKAIPNDNKCTKIVARKFKDENNPRIEFTLTTI